MKKIMNYALPFTLSGLLVSQMSFAGYPDNSAISHACTIEAHQLNHLSESKPHDKCAGDVAVASAYIAAAALQVHHEHYNEALVSLHYGESELRSIAYSRSYCAYFASLVKPSIARVIKISSELEVLERLTH